MEQQINGYYDSLYGFAMKLTKSPVLAQDLTQETILKALINRSKYNDKGKLLNWLFTLMHNQFVNDFRRNKLRKSIMILSEDIKYLEPSHSVNTDSLAIVNEVSTVLESIKYNDILQMYMDGYLYREIAERFNLPMGTIKSHIHKARKEFKINYKP